MPDATSYTPVPAGSQADAAPNTEKVKTESIKTAKSQAQSFAGIAWVEWSTIALGILGLIGTFIFGAWAIKSYNATEAANSYADKALAAAIAANDLANKSLNAALSANSYARQQVDAAQQDTTPNSIDLNSKLILLLLCATDTLQVNSSTCAIVSENLPLSDLASSLGIIPKVGGQTSHPSSTPAPTTSKATDSTTASFALTSIPTAGASPDSSSPHSAHLSLGGIIGVIIGSVLALSAAAVFILYRVRKNRHRQDTLSN
ncbi:MAG: hypothetical protein M1820_005519 [Bogoriella megaspora]|nr:MAG: hypothetical protein M1820_005519 [Bogoriella megaspora]